MRGLPERAEKTMAGASGRVHFPQGFHWGAATAAYQIEGATLADGRGESIWDRYSHTPGRIKNGDTGDYACDSYHRFDEDVAILRDLGLSSYRFSIAWPRVQPIGRGKANQKGLDYYRRLCDALLAAGIRPFPTLYHWDLPQPLEDAGGWPNRDTANRFADYAETTVEALADRVPDWIVFNEPHIFTTLGYLLGVHAPGRRDLDAFLRATHTVCLAQGEAVRAMRAVRRGLRIGTSFNMSPCEPATDSAADRDAAERWHRFTNYWFLEPALRGRYPEGAFQNGVPESRMGIEPRDMDRVKADLDFLGINLYMRTIVRAAPEDKVGLGAAPLDLGGGKDGPRTEFNWEVWPRALYDMVMRVTKDWERPVIEITENGCSYGDAPDEDGVVRDDRRIEFYRGYLRELGRAIQDGADVRGYHAWSLLDNFEWGEGYAQRFGLVWVDFDTGERTIKQSARWYGAVAAENAVDEE
jgi:beta-glucosidase